jgi:hypothetical protein
MKEMEDSLAATIGGFDYIRNIYSLATWEIEA